MHCAAKVMTRTRLCLFHLNPRLSHLSSTHSHINSLAVSILKEPQKANLIKMKQMESALGAHTTSPEIHSVSQQHECEVYKSPQNAAAPFLLAAEVRTSHRIMIQTGLKSHHWELLSKARLTRSTN